MLRALLRVGQRAVRIQLDQATTRAPRKEVPVPRGGIPGFWVEKPAYAVRPKEVERAGQEARDERMDVGRQEHFEVDEVPEPEPVISRPPANDIDSRQTTTPLVDPVTATLESAQDVPQPDITLREEPSEELPFARRTEAPQPVTQLLSEDVERVQSPSTTGNVPDASTTEAQIEQPRTDVPEEGKQTPQTPEVELDDVEQRPVSPST